MARKAPFIVKLALSIVRIIVARLCTISTADMFFISSPPKCCAARARPKDQMDAAAIARATSSAGASAAYFPLKKLRSSRYVSSGACSEG
jgi:hypothetical protein